MRKKTGAEAPAWNAARNLSRWLTSL